MRMKARDGEQLWSNIGIVQRALAGLSGRAVYGRSPAEIVGSNPTTGMDVCLL
jgi:hypothetical protein